MGEGDGATRMHWPCVIFTLLALVCDIYILYYMLYIYYIIYILYLYMY